MALCGAKNRSGEPCKKHALIGSRRCRLHGGKSTGNPKAKGNVSAVKHGFYSDALLPEELELYQRAAVGSLDDEIRLAKVKLHRYVKASGSAKMSEMVDGALEVIQKQGSDMRDIPYDKRELKAAAPNYAELIIKTLDLIRKLEQARIENELKCLEIKRFMAEKLPQEQAQITKIEIEVVGGNVKTQNDGAAGEILQPG